MISSQFALSTTGKIGLSLTVNCFITFLSSLGGWGVLGRGVCFLFLFLFFDLKKKIVPGW